MDVGDFDSGPLDTIERGGKILSSIEPCLLSVLVQCALRVNGI